MDGTFKSSTREFYQLYIIHEDFDSTVFPLFYCFLDRKKLRNL